MKRKGMDAKMVTLYTRIRAERETCMMKIDRTFACGEERDPTTLPNTQIPHAVTFVNRLWYINFFMLKHQTEKQLAMREEALKSRILWRCCFYLNGTSSAFPTCTITLSWGEVNGGSRTLGPQWNKVHWCQTKRERPIKSLTWNRSCPKSLEA